MARYNHHFANHFGGCRLLKSGHDPHRNRPVKIYAIPGEFDVVGISDGTDAWIAPVATGFLEDVRKMLVRIQQGEDVHAVYAPSRRRIGGSPTGRIIDEAEERQRVLNTALDQQQTLVRSTRRVINVPT